MRAPKKERTPNRGGQAANWTDEEGARAVSKRETERGLWVWRDNPVCELRKSKGLHAQHPLVVDGTVCQACRVAFREGDIVTLVPLGPGADTDERKAARDGRAFTAIALQVHLACATGEET